ncbi:hypothetical protein BDN67DRAFT_1004091 [Paxillus ammoniavirescens]|nr:hypothetical protein BDN67DRAFT_1004091 [Paxillus ammoniavirescens]
MQQPNYPGHGSSHSPSPRPAKADLQRAYRSKEVESFNLLRDVIKDLTGEEIQTRNEILRKAIELLQSSGLPVRNPGHHRAMGPAGHPGSHRLEPPQPPVASSSCYGMGVPPQQEAMSVRHPAPAGSSHRNAVSVPHIDNSSQWPLLGNCEYDPAGFHSAGATSSYNHEYDSEAWGSSMPEIDALCEDPDQFVTGQYPYRANRDH